ncbi:MAG TPA: universal stress protein [Terriglobales bacterium]|jgi:nucleotide-binding universal stress UspA family protein|nr:universal stress protein [Terriglobales bacterium]
MNARLGATAILKDNVHPLTIKTVLCATDFSAPAHAALVYALNIARTYDAELLLAHVLPPAPFDPHNGSLFTTNQIASAKDGLKHIAWSIGKIRHRLLLRSGDVWPALSDIINKENVDLVVTGTHGRTGAEKLAIGSVAEQILRQAHCPVLTVRSTKVARNHAIGAPVTSVRKVLFATDFSPESLAAMPLALSLAQEYQARLSLLHVLDRTDHGYTPDRNRVLSYLLEELGKLIPPEAELWCHPEYLIEFGAPAKVILEASNRLEPDFIVMGVRSSQDHLFAATHFPYSTAHKVIAGANCPVLTVLG